MCLLCKDKQRRTSERKIKIYKVLLISRNGYYVTPYINFIVEKIPIRLDDNRPEYIKTYYDRLKIFDGFFHSCRDISTAIIGAREYSEVYSDFEELIVVEGYIPKNVDYYIGENNDICSKSIVLEKIVYPKPENLLCTLWKKLKRVLNI